LSAASFKGKREVIGRAGTQALSLLAVPFHATVIRALADGPLSLADLRRVAGSPPQTTMRGYLRSLVETGVVEKRRRSEFAGIVGYELTACGRSLLGVAGHLAVWLSHAPDGSIEFGGTEAKSAIKALVEGWSASIVRVLASRPLSLTELDKVIVCLSYPSLERRLSMMRQLRMVEAAPGRGRSTPYAVTDWLRKATAPLAAAARWEQRHRSGQAPQITNRDVEAAFLLSLPLLRLPKNASGSCRLAVQMGNGRDIGLVGVVAEVKESAVASTATRLEGNPDASVLGSAAAWFAAVIEQDARRLSLSGDTNLATSLVEGLHETLFHTDSGNYLIAKSR
jgi:DNA-binding HxlR family transcriptional regulator